MSDKIDIDVYGRDGGMFSTSGFWCEIDGMRYEAISIWALDTLLDEEGIQKGRNLHYKGENMHTHEIDVFGSPCDCGTRHEYCNNCNWVEPCEIEGETK